jgi:hypothetical protein
MKKNKDQFQVILYQTDDAKTKIQVMMEGETVWLSQNKWLTFLSAARIILVCI